MFSERVNIVVILRGSIHKELCYILKLIRFYIQKQGRHRFGISFLCIGQVWFGHNLESQWTSSAGNGKFL